MEIKPQYSANTKQRVVVEVTPEMVQADLNRGLQEDEILAQGRHVFRRGNFLRRHTTSNTTGITTPKVRISINLDSDILEYFKQRASDPDAAPYQTQINNALRTFLHSEQNTQAAASSLPSTLIQSLLADPQFIDAVARRVSEQKPDYLTK